MEKSAQDMLFGENKIDGLAPILGVLALYGAYRFASWGWGVCRFFGRNYLRSGYDLYARYADPKKETYAVITGGSDGMGFCICE